MAEQFDYMKPFTITEFINHFKLGDPHNPVLTRRIGAELRSKGYVRRYHKRQQKWSKTWPVEVKLPEIP